MCSYWITTHVNHWQFSCKNPDGVCFCFVEDFYTDNFFIYSFTNSQICSCYVALKKRDDVQNDDTFIYVINVWHCYIDFTSLLSPRSPAPKPSCPQSICNNKTIIIYCKITAVALWVQPAAHIYPILSAGLCMTVYLIRWYFRWWGLMSSPSCWIII